MNDEILITQLNDFIFCPASIYFHLLYGSLDRVLYYDTVQLDGSNAHRAIDEGTYSTRQNVLQGIDVYCEQYGLIGKIDVFDTETAVLTERKKKIKTIYDGYVFQIYAQYFCLTEMGYCVKELRLFSMDDNKVYPIKLPNENHEMLNKFEQVVSDMRNFKLETFIQTNAEKCLKCIYEPACDRGIQ